MLPPGNCSGASTSLSRPSTHSRRLPPSVATQRLLPPVFGTTKVMKFDAPRLLRVVDGELRTVEANDTFLRAEP